MTLVDVAQFAVPVSIIEQTEAILQDAGRSNCEAFVLWSGTHDETAFQVRSLHYPPQTAYRTPDGLLVRVDGDALHALNAWLFENQETLAVQVHAHPTDAYHSETDDSFPIVTTLGGVSVVAADFAFHGLLNEATAAYRLDQYGWFEVPHESLLTVTTAPHGTA